MTATAFEVGDLVETTKLFRIHDTNGANSYGPGRTGVVVALNVCREGEIRVALDPKRRGSVPFMADDLRLVQRAEREENQDG